MTERARSVPAPADPSRPETDRPSPMRYLRWALLLMGAGLLAVLVARDDPGAIGASIARLSWRFAVVLCFPVTLVTLCDTLGWHFAFARNRVGFPTLVAARLAGEAVNVATPTAALGGEAVKAWLLRGRVPMAESLPSVIVAKTTIMIAQGLFLLLGLAIAWSMAIPDSPLVHAMRWLLAVETLALGGFVLVQTRGFVGWGGRLLGRWIESAARVSGTLREVDQALSCFYGQQRRRLLLSILFHFLAWALGSVETYLILAFLGVPVSLVTATIIEAFGTAIRFATFLIPASLGVLEGGYAATFTALGLSSTMGLTFSLVRRIREGFWVVLGFVVLALMRVHHSPVTASPLERD